ncbi:unnamed protein product [Jaminaea pallidilutea]
MIAAAAAPRIAMAARGPATRIAVAAPLRARTAAAFSTSSTRFSKPTTSEEASKADLHHKHSTHEDLQSHTVRSHAQERRADKVTASPNEAPTESEDVAHALRGDQGNHDDPKTLQEKTVRKASGNHH